ncbi:MAG: nicotinamide mononucleotide transporter [Syntrophorhabdaceae bacterium]|nr:nicotinamide mononucleotide transporter [Syntrophorhabdaceae bacterium]
MESLYWPLSVASVVGSILNNNRRKECFYVWIVANSFWAVIYAAQGSYPQAFQFAVFTFTSVQGLVKWTQFERKTEPKEIKAWHVLNPISKWGSILHRTRPFSYFADGFYSKTTQKY